MNQFDDVSIIKKANFYFGGKVSSRTLLFSDGSKKTLGIMSPGQYEFGTEKKEIMEIMTGDLNILLPDSDDWQTIKAGESFEVASQSKFKVDVKTLTDYCCSYLDD